MKRILLGMIIGTLALAPQAAGQDVLTADKIYVGATPSITSGSAAPSSSESDGSWYLRTNGQWYYRVGGAWATLVDTSGKIPALSSTYFSSLSGANLTNLNASSVASGNLPWANLPSGSGTWSASPTVAGDVVIGGSLKPDGSNTRIIGAADKLWKEAWISSLNSLVFTAATQTIFGGYSTIGKAEGLFAAAVATTDTTIDFGQSMTPNDFVLVRAHDTSGSVKAEYLQVGTLVSGTTYNVTRDLAASYSPNPAWASGTPFLVLGASGDGRIDLLAYDGKPRIIFAQQGATYNAEDDRVVVGNLNGYFGYSSDIYGFAAGDGSTSTLTIDPTNGVVLNGGDITLTADTSAYASPAAYKFGRVSVNTPLAGSDFLALYAYGGSHQELWLDNFYTPQTAVSLGSTVDSYVTLRARGWNGSTGLALNEASIQLLSGNSQQKVTVTAPDGLRASAGVYDLGRNVAMGDWTSVAYAAGNFTGNGSMTWTVDSGDVTGYSYTLVGHTMTVALYVTGTSVGGTPNDRLQFAVPAGKTVATSSLTGGWIENAGTWEAGFCYAPAGATSLQAGRVTAANWSTSTNTTAVLCTISFEIQ